MHAVEPGAPGPSPEQARPPRRFPRVAALGALLVVAGMAMSWTGFAYAMGEVPGWPGPVLFAGLATMAVGAGIIVRRMVVRFRRHGALAAVLAGVGGLALALLLAVAALSSWFLIVRLVTNAR